MSSETVLNTSTVGEGIKQVELGTAPHALTLLLF